MRKLYFILIFILVFSLLPSTTFAGQDGNSSSVEVVDGTTGEKMDVDTVSLMFGSDDILTDVPPMLLNDRTLVPIRFIVETLGAEINWNQEKKQATIITKDKEIILTIDSAIALVNGKEVTLPSEVPAKLIGYNDNYRTMVPFRFVSEQLGMDVNWISETKTATVDYKKQSIVDINYGIYDGIPKIAIKTTGKVNYNDMYIEALKLGMNDRLVLDLPNVDLELQNKELNEIGYYKEHIGKNGILDLRASKFETSPRDITRVVFDLEMQSGYNIEYDESNNEMYISFLNNINDIYFDYINFIDAIVIETEENPVYNVKDFGDKVVIDILDSMLKYNDNNGEIKIDNDVVKSIRFAQFEPNDEYNKDDRIVRVVLDLQEDKSMENVYVGNMDNDVIVYMNSDPMDQLQYEILGMNESKLHILLDESADSQILFDEENKKINLKIDKDLIDLPDEEVKLDMSDDIIKYIEIDGSNNNYYNIDIKYDNETTFDIASGNNTDEIIIEFNSSKVDKTQSKYEDKVIVIDAGHGENDPGAVVGNVREKDLNLDTSYKLKELLEEVGFKIYMVRPDDKYVGNYQRAEKANALGADVYVSIHHNAINNPDVYGVLTLYDGSDKNIDNKTFATIVQQELVKELKAKDRGLLNKPGIIVTRETKMPSILAELGFITNDYERQLLSKESYRQKCAQALYNGIVRYFDEVLLK